MQNLKLIKFALSTAACALALTAGAGTASAAAGSTTPCTINSFSSDNAGSPMRVTLYCNSDGFSYSINWGGTCPAINVDQQKVWQSMIQAAYLSGRKLNVWWDNACGSRAITAIQMI